MTGPVASSQPATLRLSPRCDAAEVRTAVLEIHRFLAGMGWSTEDLNSIDLALVEAGNNAVRYVKEPGRNRPVIMESVCEPDRVEFRVFDHTPGFEWPQRAELPASESESGRGIYLIQKLMDWSGYFRGPGENVLIMRKARAAGKAATGTAAAASPPAEQPADDLLEELTSCYECLSAIFRYTGAEGGAGDLKDFARRLCADLMGIAGAEWYVLRILPKGENRLAVFAASEPCLERDLPALDLRAEGDDARSIEFEAADSRRSFWFDFDKPGLRDRFLGSMKPGSRGLAHPVSLGGQLIGTLTLGRRVAAGTSDTGGRLVFTASQTNVINTLSDFLAMQITNARMQEEEVARRLMRQELEISNRIQQSLLPSRLPELEGFSLAAFCRNAREVGGDFYDVLKVSDHAALLVIADVMGKGIPAAMFAAMLRTLIRAAPEFMRRPATLLEQVNRLLFPELSGVDMFITAQLACVDVRERTITVAGAGHCPLAVASESGVKTYSPEGMPLGIQHATEYQDETAELPRQCRVLLYTDGLTEAMNERGEQFGQKRLMAWLAGAGGDAPAERLRDDLARELERFQSGPVLADDQTFLILTG